MSDLETVEEGEIDPKLTQLWIDRINKVLLIYYKRNYKIGWCEHCFGDCTDQPPLAAWVYLAKKLSYERAWANDRFAQWNPRGGKRIRSTFPTNLN